MTNLTWFVLIVLKTVQFVKDLKLNNVIYVPKELSKYLISITIQLNKTSMDLPLSLVNKIVLKDSSFLKMEHFVYLVIKDVLFVALTMIVLLVWMVTF